MEMEIEMEMEIQKGRGEVVALETGARGEPLCSVRVRFVRICHERVLSSWPTTSAAPANVPNSPTPRPIQPNPTSSKFPAAVSLTRVSQRARVSTLRRA